MEPALTFSIAVALLLTAVLATDVSLRVVARLVSLDIGGLARRRTGFLLITGIVTAGVLRATPGAAETPPAAVRLAGTTTVAHEPSVESGSPSGSRPASTHTVTRGECLWRIARDTLVARGLTATGSRISETWRAIYRDNRAVIGSDPDLIHPGQVLTLPEVLDGT